MNKDISLSAIGMLSIHAYKANLERNTAKRAFRNSYSNNPCNGVFNQEREEGSSPCWDGDEKDYCDACKITQPLHKEFILSSNKSRRLKNQLTAEIKIFIKKG